MIHKSAVKILCQLAYLLCRLKRWGCFYYIPYKCGLSSVGETKIAFKILILSTNDKRLATKEL